MKSLFVMAAAFSLVPASAQTVPQDPYGNIPSGSPVGSSSSTSSSNSAYDPRASQQMPGYNLGATPPVTGPTQVVDTERSFRDSERLLDARTQLLDTGQTRLKPDAKPGEFEVYIENVLGRTLPRFGSDLLVPSERDFSIPATATVPPDYRLNVGDVVAISMTGSIEGSVEREIDTDGRIFLPRVGSIMLAGIRYADLKDRVSAAIGRQYRGYDVTVGIRRLRGIRVYVTGFASHPGAFTVSSLSTMANAVFAAGGPSSGGSFRSVKLYRHGEEVADFDLYQLVRGGNRINDAVLQNEDVLFIPPAGPQVALVGSVNQEAIYEAKPGETLENLLAYAGGPNSLGDPTRIILYRNTGVDQPGPQQVGRDLTQTVPVVGGDILQVLSRGSLAQPVERQSVLVRVEGEVYRPGNYYVPPNTPMSQVMALAGGLTSRAFAFGTKLERTSVKAQQRESYQEAIRQLELSLAAAPITADQAQSESSRNMVLNGARAVLDQLRKAEPDGRVVLEISPAATTLPPDILLENNDRIIVPPRASTVGVFGAVYRPASFLFDDRQRPLRVRDYIDRAGGPIRAADNSGIFVVRANGEVLPRRRGALNARVFAGDVIFVPVKTQSNSFWTKLGEISTTLFQIGVTAATIGTITR